MYMDLSRKQHGGSGMNWTKADVDDCYWDWLVKIRDKLSEARAAEAKAIKDAARPKGRKPR